MKTEQKKRGRPPVSTSESTERVSIRLTPTQCDKFARLGGARWLRAHLDQLNHGTQP